MYVFVYMKCNSSQRHVCLCACGLMHVCVFMCMWAYSCTCVVCMWAYACFSTGSVRNACVYVFMYVCMCMSYVSSSKPHTLTCIHIYMHTYAHTHIRTYVSVPRRKVSEF